MKIELKKVKKKFKKQLIFDNINLKFESGKIYCLFGPNGSGKSVLLKIITNLYKVNSGKILFDNIEYNNDNICKINMRALIETPSFFPDTTGFENLKILAKIKNTINDQTIIEYLKKFNIYKDMNKKYKNYSFGMKQKLGIAQVLMENPSVMIFDELFNGIEDDTVDKIRNILLELKNQNKIIIVTSHIKEDIDILSDEVYKFNNGNVERIKWKMILN